ncbi:MAG: response regulator [Planctomycetia bacterium]
MVKVLVVDDSPTELRLTSSLLRSHGYDVVTAVDGEDALEKVRREAPQIVVCDVVMPKKNGFQVCRFLRDNLGDGVKVVLLSSKSQESDRFWGMKQGADLYLTKPYDDEELLTCVQKLA